MRPNPLLPAFAALVIAGCGGPNDPAATASTETPAPAAKPAESPKPAESATPAGPFAARLDCVRKSGGVVLIGHRGGPTRDYPENAIETFART
ncbi:MAG: hypothetical protein KBF30_12520, partial [Hyphomonadaceae bacterium]|nr:hypothetical protein [Hyphomonadaceae bacterium]